MITLQCKLELSGEDRKVLKDLMMKQSSCLRYAYNRLLEGKTRKELKKELQSIFNINSRYVDDAIFKAQALINRFKEQKKNPKKVIFGGRKLFEKLAKKHLNGKNKKELLTLWHEKRKYSLYSRGDKSKNGNLNTRIELEDDSVYLRINVGNRVWIKTKIVRKVSREKDKWISFMLDLMKANKTKKYFPYTVEIAIKNKEVYAYISYEEPVKNLEITKEYGVIGIDINASPYHLALAEVDKTGNLISYQSISLHNLLNKNRHQREYLLWQIAHKVIDIALEKNKAIVIERLSKISKGYVGDGIKKLRKRLHQWSYKYLLNKIKTLAKREGIEVIEINPYFTSIIGMLKYAPQYNIDKDIAAAYVIGRKGLGFKERLSKNYKKYLNTKECLEYSLYKLMERKEELKNKLKEIKNNYQKNPIKKELLRLNKEIKLLTLNLENLNSEPLTQYHLNQWKEDVRDGVKTPYKQWQAIKIALILPILGKSFNRDFSSLKQCLVDWDRSVSRLVPVLGIGAIADSKYRLSGMSQLEMAEYKYPDLKCSEAFQFYTL